MTATATAPQITVSPIYTDEDVVRAQRRILALWGAKPGTKRGDELHVLADLVEAYEHRHLAAPETTGVDALRSIMDGNNLTQSDLSEVGTQGVVSQILRGQRQLNVRQIKALAGRFKVPPGVFL